MRICLSFRARAVFTSAMFLATVLAGRADVITETNARATAIAARVPVPLMAARAIAVVQVSVFEAVNAISGKYQPFVEKINAAPDVSIEAAVAAATRTALTELVPGQQSAIESDYQNALQKIPDGTAKSNGVAVGEAAAAAIVSARRDDGASAPNTYRPYTKPGVYVPTTLPAGTSWGNRKPWLMNRADQFRPGPPPDLTSDTWARDFNESKAMGGQNSTQRTPEQSAVAQFWQSVTPDIYWQVVRCVADAPNRDVTENARLLATVGMALDDALIAVFEAKYHYNFWRPMTAIRNADLDGNDATELEPGWTPFIETPPLAEYPCAHCIAATAVCAVLNAEIGTGPTPKLSSTSPTAPGAVRTWNSVADIAREVSEARICGGMHYRSSTEVGSEMGRKIGELATRSFPRSDSVTGSPR